MTNWREKPITEKQKLALFNIRYALGITGAALHETPKNRGAASDELGKLKKIVQHNLSIGGSINPKRSVYASSGDWGVDHNGQ